MSRPEKLLAKQTHGSVCRSKKVLKSNQRNLSGPNGVMPTGSTAPLDAVLLFSPDDAGDLRPQHSPSSCVSEELLGSVGSSSSLVMSSEDRFPRLAVGGAGM